MGLAHADRARLQRRALALEYATIAWNLGEAVLTIGLGVAAGSLALIGFGADSIIEVFASSVVVWHLRPGHEVDHPARTRRVRNSSRSRSRCSPSCWVPSRSAIS
ncbi:MAG TPA: hypothetical protein VFZ96_07840 [Actinomycetota bacterium]|nr:hypothetical protein [Actinomycetota bacterium]